ncbi:MAG TPA: glycerol-3-phosphate 1-O-acyltransferase PlsY [Plasticicumulans sp.]|uniref:glycerol-3-phosphate 1-O-acyltransferase PlsY n=1 Tax=Plasticicumulans sp. TaxID=2307179 RepID=UPI002CC2B999|nr:glycerol-3-phosphate 1-O-acyltransferase PlsY [Plasticicumulans sp.]HMW30877.1 glycerol-3-phosphate 1-O-acyltransferase PlsY [Plasticicumulans sp.]HMW42629.1 glycerol-3-phosphate 1-O-acyltransferase PlsY [Plasticicumulans sp.]
MTSALLCLVFAYLCGSVSTAILVCRLMGLPDPRSEGSRNPGATNVLRIGGRKAAAITLAGDFLKGLIPVVVARAFGQGPEVLAATAFAAFLGHLYPVFFGFQGGKGVATALGVMVGLSWQVALAALATWLVIARVWKISSLAALGAATLSPLYALLFGLPGAYALALLPMVALLLWRHRENIRRIRAGTESRIGDKKKT